MIILSETDVAALLPIEDAIEVVERAMMQVSAGATNLPLRSVIPVGGPNMMGIMPGAMASPACYGVKLVSLFPANPAAGYSSHQGAVVLFEAQHGSPVCFMNAGLLTALRTAAASAAATRALALPDAACLAIIGTGEQAHHHLDAMCSVRSFAEVRIVGRDQDKAARFVADAAARFPGMRVVSFADVRSAVDGADVVCTVTSASEPILLGEWILPGTHLNVAGASIPSKREIDTALVARASLFVDYRASTQAQAGEYIAALAEGRIGDDHIRAEIGEVFAGRAAGRSRADEITIYRSLGVAAQDLACAYHCMERAMASGMGAKAAI